MLPNVAMRLYRTCVHFLLLRICFFVDPLGFMQVSTQSDFCSISLTRIIFFILSWEIENSLWEIQNTKEQPAFIVIS